MNCKMTQRAIDERLPDSTATLPDSLLVHINAQMKGNSVHLWTLIEEMIS